MPDRIKFRKFGKFRKIGTSSWLSVDPIKFRIFINFRKIRKSET